MSERRRLMMADKPKLWLYKDGDECTSITGGWTSSGYTVDTFTVYEGQKTRIIYVY